MRNKKGGERLIISIKEIRNFIISILIHKFNLKCSIHLQKNRPTIYISSKSIKKLRPFILPYMCDSMVYKLGVEVAPQN